jgi:hypothetical protein
LALLRHGAHGTEFIPRARRDIFGIAQRTFMFFDILISFPAQRRGQAAKFIVTQSGVSANAGFARKLTDF